MTDVQDGPRERETEMKAMLRQVGRTLRRVHRDEGGATMVEYILIIAAVALPILAALLWFWRDIKEWVTGEYDQVRSGQGTDPH